jgi:hypothetical protein
LPISAQPIKTALGLVSHDNTLTCISKKCRPDLRFVEKYPDSDIKFDIRKNHSGIKPQGLAVLQGVLDGNVQVTANAKKILSWVIKG